MLAILNRRAMSGLSSTLVTPILQLRKMPRLLLKLLELDTRIASSETFSNTV
jgi:hypothetical protein